MSKKRNLTDGEKVLDYLNKHPCYSFNAKTIANSTGVSYTATRKALSRYAKKGIIVKERRGFYMSRMGCIDSKGLPEPQLLFHGIKIEYRGEKCPEINTESYLHRKFPNVPKFNRHPVNHSIIVHYSLKIDTNFIPLTITAHKKVLEIWIKGTADKPLNLAEFLFISGWIVGFFEIPPNEFKIAQIGINIDSKELHLDGATNITLSGLSNMLMRIYQHQHFTRFEVHVNQSTKKGKALALEEAINLLNYGIKGSSSIIECTNLLKQLNRDVASLPERTAGIILGTLFEIASEIIKPSQDVSEEMEDIFNLKSLGWVTQ